MPSGKTHDAVTFFLTAPVGIAAGQIIENAAAGLVVGIAFLIGGLMFGPDLDTMSKQYTRWGIFRFLWFPYQAFFSHRSRWSHGLIFGTLIRVIYSMGILTLLAFGAVYFYELHAGGGNLPDFMDFVNSWGRIGDAVRYYLGEKFLLHAFIGLWLGAASHTITDIIGSYLKTGRVSEFL